MGSKNIILVLAINIFCLDQAKLSLGAEDPPSRNLTTEEVESPEQMAALEKAAASLAWEKLEENQTAIAEVKHEGSNPDKGKEQLSSFPGVITRVIGGAIDLMLSSGQTFSKLARLFGLVPKTKLIIIDNKSKCDMYFKCWSAFDKTGEHEVETEDGVVVKFQVSFWKPEALTAWQCSFRRGNRKFTSYVYGTFSAPKLGDVMVYDVDNNGLGRMDRMISQIKQGQSSGNQNTP